MLMVSLIGWGLDGEMPTGKGVSFVFLELERREEGGILRSHR